MKHIRNLACRLLAVALAVGLAGCSVQVDGSGRTTAYTPAQMAEVVLDTQPEQPQLYLLQAADGDFAARLRDGYLLDPAGVVDGAICYPLGFEAAEVTILHMADEAAAAQAAAALRDYAEARENTFSGYAPAQAQLAAQGAVVERGLYVALLICPQDGAEAALLSCFDAQPPALPATSRLLPHAALTAPTDGSGGEGDGSRPSSSEAGGADAYDHDAVLEAWRTGDESALTEKNRTVLQTCREVIAAEVTEGMTEYEKELAIHDWIIAWADYDVAAESLDPRAKIEPDHDNPYGLLVAQKAICSGYSSTFQLFMDLLDIECMTVSGAARDDYAEHAWNQVRLDGEWYCVDVTWDDPNGVTGADPAVYHMYFNVTSRHMRNTNHHWDADAVPECTATEYRWRPD